MRILHFVTLVTPDGAFGGPVRVAMNQAKELQSRGHDVTIVGGAQGFQTVIPNTLNGVPARLFKVRRYVPRTGFAGLTSLTFLFSMMKLIRKADIVHVHLTRDLMTMPAAWISTKLGRRTVVQPHGMIDPSAKLLARLMDRAFIRSILRNAHVVLHLTPEERQGLTEIESRQTFEQIQNGVELPPRTVLDRARREPRLPEVLFLARLHEIKRPREFVEVAGRLLMKFPETQFSLVGPDEGESEAIQLQIETDGSTNSITLEGALAPEDTLARMAMADIYVLPSRSEVMPMGALEAMSIGLPVVLCSPCGLENEVRSYGAGIIADQSSVELEEAIGSLLASKSLRKDLGISARRLIEDKYSISKVIDSLEKFYFISCEGRH